MPRSALLVGTLVVSLLVLATRAHATPVIDFESFVDGDLLTTQIPGLTITNAVVLTAGIGLNEFELPPASGVNVLANTADPVTLAFLPITLTFDTPIGLFSGFFTHDASLLISAFDTLGVLLGTASAAGSNLAFSGDPGSSPNEFLSVAFSGIASVEISGGSFVMDDIAVVPEPGTLWLFGLGAMGLARKMRRTQR